MFLCLEPLGGLGCQLVLVQVASAGAGTGFWKLPGDCSNELAPVNVLLEEPEHRCHETASCTASSMRLLLEERTKGKFWNRPLGLPHGSEVQWRGGGGSHAQWSGLEQRHVPAGSPLWRQARGRA